MNICINCQVEYYVKSKTSVCCSPHCRAEYKYKKYIELWKGGKIDGKTKSGEVIGYVRRYLGDTYKYKCSACGWDKVNPYTNRVPLEVDHINGNRSDCSIANLRLLCPNCHSLTPTYKGRNRGMVKLYSHVLQDPAFSEHLYEG